MARVRVNVQGRKGVAELSRVPVRGDLIPTGSNSAVEVTEVVLFSPNSEVDAVVFAAPAQRDLSMDSAAGVLAFEDEKESI